MATNKVLDQLTHLTDEGGDGIIVERDFPLGSVKTTGGLTLTASTAPTIAATESNGVAIVGAASTTALGTILWGVPIDYDRTSDYLRVKVLCEMGGATDATNTIDATVYRKRAGTALSADLNPTASAAIPASASPTDDAAIRELILTGLSCRPGDALTINLLTAAHTTDAVNIWAVWIEYKSMIVARDITNRS